MTRRFISELRVSPGAQDELWAHGLTEDDALEVSWDKPVFRRDKVDGRNKMIGRNEGGEILTIVIEWLDTPGVCDVVTGWASSRGERTEWQKEQPKGSK